MNPRAAANAILPGHWSRRTGRDGSEILTYAVPPAVRMAFAASGGALLLAGCWLTWRLLAMGGPAPEVLLLTLLVSGCTLTLAFQCLDRAYWRRDDYLLGKAALALRRTSLLGDRREYVSRRSITAIVQYRQRTPSRARCGKVEWSTVVVYQARAGRVGELAISGRHGEDEARWLGGLLSAWSGAPVLRGDVGADD